MKRRKGIICTAVLVIIISITFSYFKYGKPALGSSKDLQPVAVKQDSLTIMVDPRIELLSSVQLISYYPNLTELDFKYRNSMNEYFSPYSGHKIVGSFLSMYLNGFSYDAPPSLMLYYSNPPVLKKQIEVDNILKLRSGGDASIDDFIKNINSYCKESGFEKFYNSNLKFYKSMVDETAQKIKDINIVKDLEDYYGIKQHSYNLILGPMIHDGGYGPRVIRNDGNYDIYGIIGPGEVREGIPQYSRDNIIHISWHEFGHSFVNPETSKYINELDKYSKLFDPIRDKMLQQSYGKWEICVNEHIVRAVAARFSLAKYGQEQYQRVIDNEKGKGFFYIEPICRKLEEYENNRDKYKTFGEFYSELVKVFKELSESDLGKDYYRSKFYSPIDVVSAMGNPVVFITPTGEEDKEVQIKINTYVNKTKAKLMIFKNAEVITDEEALKRDLSSNTIMVYGTMEGNLWLAKYKDKVPFRIFKDKIVAGKDYIGESLRFISALPNPLNSDNPLVIFTAQKAEDIAGINSIYFGPTDYVISDGEAEIASREYNKENGEWRFK